MPDSEAHRLARRVAKARRAAGRRGNRVIVRWRPQRSHRCVGCGRWIGLGAEAGYGSGAAWCESCFVAAELRRVLRLTLPVARALPLTGAA